MSKKSEPTISSQSTCSVQDGHVKTSAQPERSPDLKDQSRDSGKRSAELLAIYSPDTLSWKTLQRSLLGGLVTFSGTWPRSGMMLSGNAYRLRQSARPSLEEVGIESLSWPSPTATDACGRGYHGSLEGNYWPALPGAIALSLGYPVQHPITGKICPKFVESLMGFPTGWTALDASEML